ncbi:MAG TPA: PKD domain-containing protein, partial [Nitriliruptorales bacterium]|nr:PKD domain-containing protein [Nitriliruptorales bacterium]
MAASKSVAVIGALAVIAMLLPVSPLGDRGLIASAVADEAADPLLPVFLDDVAAQFGALSIRPDGLAFDIGTSPDPRLCKHYQGLARVNGPGGTSYLLVSRSGNQPGGFGSISCPFEDDDPGNLLVVRLGSRDANGERLRSNRFQRGWPINGDVNVPIGPTPPDERDRVVNTIFFDGGVWPNYAHPGGMQVIGDVLVLAMEAPYDEALPDNLFMFIDVSDPEKPSLLSQWEPPEPGGEFSAGLAGITAIRTSDGDCCRYVMVATGKANKDVRFFRSLPTEPDGSTDLHSPGLAWEETARFSEGEIEDCLGTVEGPFGPIQIDWHTGGGDAHQSLNLVRQGNLDGPLYMIGARNDTPLPSGEDRMDLYRITLDAGGVPPECFIELLQNRHFQSHPYMGGGDSANFAAASGVYLSPAGELIVYAAEFENDGPVGVSGHQTVRFGEYRHRDMARPGSPTLRPSLDVPATWDVDEGSAISLSAVGEQAITRAWIQTFEDDGAGSNFPDLGGVDSDEWLAVDYPDRDADDFDDFGALRANGVFDENAGSWRWFAPVGCTIRANDFAVVGGGDLGPDTQMLAGIGSVVVETDLDDIDFDDDMGSVTFLPDCDEYYAAAIGVSWDLDGNGTFETQGTSTEFDAALIDGPETIGAAAQAQHPTDPTPLGTSSPTPLTIRVHNVAPIIETLDVEDSTGNSLNVDVPVTLPGLPLTLSATFTDPGVVDTQTATIDWGDGTVDTTFDTFSDASGGITGVLGQEHTYAGPGSYDVTVTVEDDDGGVTTQVVTIEVVTAAEAIEIAAGT